MWRDVPGRRGLLEVGEREVALKIQPCGDTEQRGSAPRGLNQQCTGYTGRRTLARTMRPCGQSEQRTKSEAGALTQGSASPADVKGAVTRGGPGEARPLTPPPSVGCGEKRAARAKASDKSRTPGTPVAAGPALPREGRAALLTGGGRSARPGLPSSQSVFQSRGKWRRCHNLVIKSHTTDTAHWAQCFVSCTSLCSPKERMC